jgi:tetratricopeptide (TPR) repeat protein
MYKEAIEFCKEAKRIDPGVDTHRASDALTGAGRHKEAVKSDRQSIRINPDDANTHRELGDAYIGAGQHKEAIDVYKQALEIDPDDADTHYNLGVAYVKAGMHKEAIKSFQQVIRINPDDADALAVLEQYEMFKSLDPELANKLFN